ncbi:DNA-3-methyladenine glycosylase 2 family protein [uncultured Sulfitobacter sp.]|uniref:DNA-3-methyladenine glycosylase family protein n=1 Tax=uncultured Sulfitobacter sp. TaxID=191468 RepID=UPI0026177B60|nr:DNA-3-methyladenine glycosylase 2 family protein [uncultured Sulfitobacter sp.]
MRAGLVTGPADVAEGAAWLVQAEPRFQTVLDVVNPLPLRLKPPGFATLIDIIISQQVSLASAAAIRARMEAAGLMQQDAVRLASDADLQGAGLSRPKVRYVRAVADAALAYETMIGLSDDDLTLTLTAIKGIGPWTAQIYGMFAMGRADMFAPGDLALQEAAKVLFDLDARPDAKTLAHMAQDWSPWRSVAARALFAYYRVIKNRDGLL